MIKNPLLEKCFILRNRNSFKKRYCKLIALITSNISFELKISDFALIKKKNYNLKNTSENNFRYVTYL